MTAPAIMAFRLVTPLPPPGVDGCVAILTVEDGPWLVAGFRLHRDPSGRFYMKPPRVKLPCDRVVFRASPQRDAILEQAKIMARGFLAANAASPLATAPQLEHRT